MYARLLFAWPEEPPYAPLTDEIDENDPDFVHALRRLVDSPAEEGGWLIQSPVPLAKAGRQAFEAFPQANNQERRLCDGCEREYLSKGSAHVLRLSGTLEIIELGFPRS